MREKERERDRERREGIVRGPGVSRADMPSDRPENGDELAHPQDVNEFHGDPQRDRRASDEEPGPTGSTPRS